MFRQMRRKDKLMPLEESVKILKEGEYGILATVGEDGYPYAVPLNYVYRDNHIYFHCAVEGHKLDNIRFNPKVSFCVVGEAKVDPEELTTDYKSVIVFGKACEVEGEEKKQALYSLAGKYSDNTRVKGGSFDYYVNKYWDRTRIVRIYIENISGKGK